MKKKKILLSILVFAIYIAFPHMIDGIINLFKIDLSGLNIVFAYIFIYSLELIPAVAFVIIYKKDLIKDFKDFKKNIMNYADKYVKYWLLGIVLMSISSSIVSVITKSDVSNNEEAIRTIAKSLPIYIAFSSCICAPLVEELAYRKTIKNIFINKKLSIIASGIIFGLAHVISTYTGILDLLYVIPYGVLGSVFMYIYADSNNIWTTISIHFLHNTILMTAYFLRGVI